jgi:hypothetical protein
MQNKHYGIYGHSLDLNRHLIGIVHILRNTLGCLSSRYEIFRTNGDLYGFALRGGWGGQKTWIQHYVICESSQLIIQCNTVFCLFSSNLILISLMNRFVILSFSWFESKKKNCWFMVICWCFFSCKKKTTFLLAIFMNIISKNPIK